MPAVRPTFSRSMNWSNGDVASSRQAPSEVMSARAESGSSQYGPRSQSPRLGIPKTPWLYQRKPRMVVTTTANAEIRSRPRSSVRCSTSDMVPSGLTRDRRRRGSIFLKTPGICTAA